MDDIFKQIVKAFDALWKVRPRGNSIEIITPFPAARDKYVSVFVTVQYGNIIVTDGGWLDNGTYMIGSDAPELTKIFDRIFDYYLKDFSILRTRGADGRIICFKKTTERIFVPNLVFELANFISIVSGTAIVPLRDEIERRNIFRSKAIGFLKQRVRDDKLETNAVYSEAVPAAKFNAIVRKDDGKSLLMNFVTGSKSDYVISSYCKSNTMFDLIQEAGADKCVRGRVVIMDDKASGYSRNELAPFFEMSRAKGQTPILWSSGAETLTEFIS